MKRYQKMLLILTLAITAALLAGCGSISAVADGAKALAFGEGSGSGDVKRETWSFDGDDFDSVKVQAKIMNIHLESSSENMARIELATDRDISDRITLNAEVKGGELRITVEEKQKRTWFWSNQTKRGERTLAIVLPEKLNGSVEVSNNVGKVRIEGLQADKVEVRQDVGDIHLDQVSGKLQLETATGTIRMEDLPWADDVKAATNVGDIRIQVDKQPAAGEVRLQTNVGKVSADLKGVEYSKNTRTEMIGSFGAGGPKLEATTEVGSIAIE